MQNAIKKNLAKPTTNLFRHSITSKCTSQKSDTDIVANCTHLQRICNGLRFYESLREVNQLEELLVDYVETKYPQLIDDSIHLIRSHNHQLIQIGEEMSSKSQSLSCELAQCAKMRRHYRMNTYSVGSNSDD